MARYVLDRLFDNLTDKSYRNIDDRNNVDMLRIITRETKSKFQLTIGVFSIAFVMSVIEKFTELLNTVTMKYELRNKCWINKHCYNGNLCLFVVVEMYGVCNRSRSGVWSGCGPGTRSEAWRARSPVEWLPCQSPPVSPRRWTADWVSRSATASDSRTAPRPIPYSSKLLLIYFTYKLQHIISYRKYVIQSCLSTTRPVITLIGCNAVGRAS